MIKTLMKYKLFHIAGSLSAIFVCIGIAFSMAYAIVYVPVPSYTLLSPTIPGTYVVGGSTYSYYTIGFATAIGGGGGGGGITDDTEPLPTNNVDSTGVSVPVTPFDGLFVAWAWLWDVPVNIPWIIGSLFLAIVVFIAVAYYFQHIGMAMMFSSIVIGFFSMPDINVLPVACLIIAIFGVISGIAVEARA
jgi:hypothetical protein